MATIENKEFHDFVMSDFSQMFSEKRHTDGRYTFFISMYFTIIAISVSVFAFITNQGNNDLEGLATIFAIVFFFVSVFGMIIVAAMYFNRVNNIKAIRQINYTRKFYLDNSPDGHKEFSNEYIMNKDPDAPPFFKINTTQMIFMILISVFNSLSIGASLFLIFQYNISQETLYLASPVIIAVLILLTQLFLFSYKLKKKDEKNKSPKEQPKSAE